MVSLDKSVDGGPEGSIDLPCTVQQQQSGQNRILTRSLGTPNMQPAFETPRGWVSCGTLNSSDACARARSQIFGCSSAAGSDRTLVRDR